MTHEDELHGEHGSERAPSGPVRRAGRPAQGARRAAPSAFIAVGVVSVLAIVTLRREAPTADASLVPIGKALVAIHDWTFVLGPGFVVGVGNGMILGYMMYRSGLVPRRMAVFGLIGGPLICLSGIAVVMHAIDKGSAGQGIATIPEFLWELSLGLSHDQGIQAASVTCAHQRVP